MAGAWYFSTREGGKASGDALLGRFSYAEKSYVKDQMQKSSPLIERNDVTLWAKANAAGEKSARASPLILEESEGLAALAARQRGRV